MIKCKFFQSQHLVNLRMKESYATFELLNTIISKENKWGQWQNLEETPNFFKKYWINKTLIHLKSSLLNFYYEFPQPRNFPTWI